MPSSNAWTCTMIAAVTACVSLAAAPAHADWPASGLPIASGSTHQRLPVGLTGPDGQLHAFWVDWDHPSYVLHTQHVTLQGTLASGWPVGGRGVVALPAAISSPEIAPDGSGGAILAWYDLRSGAHGIYATRVNSEAAITPGWSPAGTPICTASGPLNDLVAVCGDGAGGAFVAWTDARNTPSGGTFIYDVFAHHVQSDGSLDPSWPATGRALTTGPGYKYPHVLIADGGGGFWLATENSNATSRIAATHHSANGIETSRWTSPSFANRVIGTSDGVGGVFLTWKDCRDCLGGSNGIYAIRLGPADALAAGWPVGGVALVNSTDNVDLPVIVATGDGAAMIAWLRSGVAPDAYVARRVEANGSFASAWAGGGQTFAVSTDILGGWPLIAPDGAGGAMFAFRRNWPNLFGSRVSGAAQIPPAFPDTGLALCTLSGNQFPVSLVSDGQDGAYLLWEDSRDSNTSTQFDVYAMRFTRDGLVGSTTGVPPTPVAPGGLAMSAPRPNPASGLSSFQLTLAASARVFVEVLDVAGRRLAVLYDGDLDAGSHPLQWDGRDQAQRRMPPGIYLLSARTADATVGRRIVLVP